MILPENSTRKLLESEKNFTHDRVQVFVYPETKRVDVTENVHGVEITDSFRWLEENSNETKTWVTKQNDYAQVLLQQNPSRSEIFSELHKSFDLGFQKCPWVVNGYTLQWKREPHDKQEKLYISNGDNVNVLLDPNEWDKDGLTAVNWTSTSHDASYIAYGVSKRGTEDTVLKIRKIDSLEDEEDIIPNTKYASVSWLHDNSGFFYRRTDNKNIAIYHHQIGDDWHNDKVIFKPDSGVTGLTTYISDDNRYLLVSAKNGLKSNRLYIAETNDVNQFSQLQTENDTHAYPLMHNGFLYILTDSKAQNFRLMRTKIEESTTKTIDTWDEIIPTNPHEKIDDYAIVGDKLILTLLNKAHSRIKIFNLDGSNEQDLNLPTIGTVSGLNGEPGNKDMFWMFESYSYPPTIFRTNIETLQTQQISQLETIEDLSDVVTTQVVYLSADGTPITMFITKKKDVELNGSSDTILYGYGGFGASMTPQYGRSTARWVAHGGIYAVPNLRGGGEYGSDWHKSGRELQKKNVFDDFIAAAEFLQKNNYTQKEKLVAWGSSHGGLVVAASAMQRPDLFSVVISDSPRLDMIHFASTNEGTRRIPEYGNPDIAEHFQYLLSYSPYHTVKDNQEYPAFLFLTGSNDPRTQPWDARKMTAKLQNVSNNKKPILLLEDPDDGHWIGRPVTKTISKLTNIFTFINSNLS